MPEPLIECVPNFSEGRDMGVMRQITDAIESVEGVTLLDVDPGAATNRTVVTFVGPPEPAIEAAVRAGAKAKALIDMRKHHGEHPRFGAMDVCPLVPVAGITMDEVVPYAHKLGQRLGDEAGISGYFYEYAAKQPERRNLATCRAGEYEALPQRLKDPQWKTDFGPGAFDPGYGVTAVGARDFLVAYNVNLNTTSTRRANAIAFDVREKGRQKREGDPLTGPIVKDASGNPVWVPGSLKCVKGIGWFIEEYGVAQISMNLTNISVTPVHVAFDECVAKAAARGVRVTGSEIVGLIPLTAMLDAGKHYLRKQQRSLGISDREIIRIAIKSMGLDDLKPFNPRERIIEYAIAARQSGAAAGGSSASGATGVSGAPADSRCHTHGAGDRCHNCGAASSVSGAAHGVSGAAHGVSGATHGVSGAAPSVVEPAISRFSRLIDMPIEAFTHETASESPAPGGGSISAAVGAFGAALATMVANLSAHKRGWDDRWEEFSDWAEKGKAAHDELLRLVDEDTAAFNKIMDAFGLPKGSAEEQQTRQQAIDTATKGAIEVPLRVMQVALDSFETIKAMAETGLPASISDAGVAALCARTAVMGAYLNVKINAKGLDDRAWVGDVLKRGAAMQEQAQKLEAEVLGIVEGKV